MGSIVHLRKLHLRKSLLKRLSKKKGANNNQLWYNPLYPILLLLAKQHNYRKIYCTGSKQSSSNMNTNEFTVPVVKTFQASRRVHSTANVPKLEILIWGSKIPSPHRSRFIEFCKLSSSTGGAEITSATFWEWALWKKTLHA